MRELVFSGQEEGPWHKYLCKSNSVFDFLKMSASSRKDENSGSWRARAALMPWMNTIHDDTVKSWEPDKRFFLLEVTVS